VLLQNKERELVLYADRFLLKNDYLFDVLIHDGGLVRKKGSSESHFRKILENLNHDIQNNLKLENVRFVQQDFDFSFHNAVNQEEEHFIEYTYLFWKFYLENYRDLCYISKDQIWLFADNAQTNVHKSKDSIRTAVGTYWILQRTIPLSLQKCQLPEEVQKPSAEKDERPQLINEENEAEASNLSFP